MEKFDRFVNPLEYRFEKVVTKRQGMIIDEVFKGISNKDIAANLGIVENTVKFHLTKIFKIFGVKTRQQLLAYAYKYNIPR
jgi:DNA-binding CsgD family transcriptional regulator